MLGRRADRGARARVRSMVVVLERSGVCGAALKCIVLSCLAEVLRRGLLAGGA